MRSTPPRAATLGLSVLGLCLVAGSPGPNSATIPSTGQLGSIAITSPADGVIITVPPAGPAAVPIPVVGSVAIGTVAGNPINVMSVVDVSGSTGNSGNDCNGDGSINLLDDFNDDGAPGRVIDCEIAGVIALNQSLASFANLDVGLVSFNSFGRIEDVNPITGGTQFFTSPAEQDLDMNGVPDLEQAATGLFSSGGTNFDRALIAMNQAFATRVGETNVAFFLTDGFGSLNRSLSGPLQVAVNAGTVVNTFSVGRFGDDCSPGSNIRFIADRTGGTCTEVDDPSNLASALPGVTPALLDRVEVDGQVVSVDALGQFMTTAECPSDNASFNVQATAFFNDPDFTTVSADVDIHCEGDCPFSTANPASLGAAGGYNVVVFDDYTGGLDIEGAVAVGNDATFGAFNLGYGLSGGDAIVVGNDLTLTSGTVGGNAVYGNLGTAPAGVTFNNGGSLQQGTPLDFDTLETDLDELSMDLAELFPTDVTQVGGDGSLTMVGTNSDLNVFVVSESEIEGATSLLISAPAGSTVVVNVAGSDLDFGNFQWSLTGVTASQVIVNLYEATTADLTSVGVRGTLLAPTAAMSFSAGDLSGTLVAQSLTGSVELYDHPFTGVIDQCPDDPAPPVTDCLTSYQITNIWPQGSGFGYQVQVGFSHNGEPLNDWMLDWSYTGADAIQNLWNGSSSQTGMDVTVSNPSWSGNVQPGQSVSFGFIGSTTDPYPTLPTQFRLNGVVCH